MALGREGRPSRGWQASRLGFILGSWLFGLELAGAEEDTLEASEPPPAHGARVVEEITVTATKRETSTQEIPLSIEVVAGETLTALEIDEISDLSTLVPNFNAGFGLITEAITLRGVGSGQERSFEQAVALFSDGFYLPRSRQAALPFLDVERVEVMRGPQSVVHGLNATAGAVSIVTRRTLPGDPFTFDLTTGYELEHGGPTLSAAVGGSPTETLGLRAAFRFADSEGYFVNTASGREEGDRRERLGRLSAVWSPLEKLLLTAKVEHGGFDLDGHSGEIFGLAAAALEPSDGLLNWRRSSDGSSVAPQGVLGEDQPGVFLDSTLATLRLDAVVGESTLSFLGGFSELDYRLASDVDATAQPLFDAVLDEGYEQTGFELRWASSAYGAVSYVAGVYAHDTRLSNLQPNFFGPAALGPGTGLAFSSIYDLDSELWSVFASSTVRISDQLRLLGGVRYSSEDKHVRRDSTCQLVLLPDTFVPAPPALAAALCPSPKLDGLERSRTSDQWMPEIALEWNAADNVLVYAKAGRSAKAGGFAAATATRPEEFEYDDETATGWEVGVKSRLGGGVAQVNLAVFSTEFDDLQVNAVLVEEQNGLQVIRPIVRNAARAESEGLEIEGRWVAGRSLLVGGSLAWLDAEYLSFPGAPCNTVEANASGACDLSGRELPFAASWSANAFLDLDHPIRSGYRLLAGLDVAASDGYFTDGTLDPHARQEAWTRISARLGVTTADRRWTVALIGRNLTDEAVLESSQGFGDTHFLGYLAPPRSIHLQTSYRFRGVSR